MMSDAEPSVDPSSAWALYKCDRGTLGRATLPRTFGQRWALAHRRARFFMWIFRAGNLGRGACGSGSGGPCACVIALWVAACGCRWAEGLGGAWLRAPGNAERPLRTGRLATAARLVAEIPKAACSEYDPRTLGMCHMERRYAAGLRNVWACGVGGCGRLV